MTGNLPILALAILWGAVAVAVAALLFMSKEPGIGWVFPLAAGAIMTPMVLKKTSAPKR